MGDASPNRRGPPAAVTWASDRQTVTKRFPDRSHIRRFGAERRINRLLSVRTPPVPFPRLLRSDRRMLELEFEAVAGDVLGPKYPLTLPAADVDGMIDLAERMRSYRPRTNRIRRLGPAWILDAPSKETLRVWLRDDPPVWSFAHADIKANNVLRSVPDGRMVLIDWEWGGLYPRGWEHAMLWYTLIDVPGGRECVAATVPKVDELWFWRSALMITLLHLRLPTMPAAFRPNHERTRDELFDLLRSDIARTGSANGRRT